MLECNDVTLCNDVTPTVSKTVSKTDIPPTPKGDGGEKIPPSEVRAELSARRPSPDEIFLGGRAMGVPDEFVKEFVADMDQVGWVWVNPAGRTVYVNKANWRTVLKGRFDFRKKKFFAACGF